MTNDKADFTQGNISEKTGRFYDADSRGIDSAGGIRCS